MGVATERGEKGNTTEDGPTATEAKHEQLFVGFKVHNTNLVM